MFFKDTEAKKARKPHVHSRRLKGDVEKAQVAEKAAKATPKVTPKVSRKASSGVSSGSKRDLEVATGDAVMEYEQPPQKRSRADKLGTVVPFTSITRAPKIARVKAAV